MIYHRLWSLIADHQIAERAPEALYTVCFGNYDRINIPRVDPSISCHIFIDSKSDAEIRGWRIHQVNLEGISPLLAQRAFKCLCHLLFPQTQKVYYCNSSFYFLQDATPFLRERFAGDFSVCQHSSRTDVFEEAAACVKQGKSRIDDIERQIDSYRRMGFNKKTLYETGIIGRNCEVPGVRKLNEKWIQEILAHSPRDQISLPYAEWACAFEIDPVKENIFYNRHMVPLPHSKASFRENWKRRIALSLHRAGFLDR